MVLQQEDQACTGPWLCRDDDQLEDEINSFAYAEDFDEDAFACTDDFTAFD